MASSDWVTSDNSALFTDLYQLTMLQAYHREGMGEPAVFDLFIRRLGRRNFVLACGLDTVLDYLEELHFSEESLAFLASTGKFDSSFLAYLEGFRFSGSVYAVREGTPIFPDEPILEVVAPIAEAQLVETFLLNQITFQTNVATKASLVRLAAGERTVADFGMRRMHGADAALKAARAFHIAGLDSTSNVLAGQVYGIPTTGTMAHSYIEAHGSEEDAFRAFASFYDDAVLLVDTYDTLEGIRKIARLAKEGGAEFRIGGVRLDSGDLAELARESRRILDAEGLQHVRILASGSLDEHEISRLLEGGAPIDGFGVGTRMGTIADQPYLDSVYKLSAYAGKPRMKLSTEKSTLPGRKQIYRSYQAGIATHDVISTADERLEGRPLLETVMESGTRMETSRFSLDEIRDYSREELSVLPSRLLSLVPDDRPYEVRLSEGLKQLLDETRAALQ
ncbi:MAG: nicotinate phosphoribosyltransferase [Rhodothermales bacterium]